MRILILSQYFPPEIGAAQTRLAAMARTLVQLGHEVEVVTALPNYPAGRIFPGYRGTVYRKERWEGIPVRRVWVYPALGAGFRRLLNYASFTATCLVGLAGCRRPDYLFAESPPLFLSVPAVLAARFWRVPLVFNVADLWPDSVRELGVMGEGPILRAAEALERWTYRQAERLTAVTEGIRTTLTHKKGVPPRKILFLPNGADLEIFHPGLPDQALYAELGVPDLPLVLYAGTHGYAHGLEVALHAALLLADENVQFVFVGDGSEKARLVGLAKKMNLTNVTFLASVPPEKVSGLYRLAAIALSTLRDSPLFEGTRPAKVLTAMASGTPVVYSGAGEGARLVEEAGAGLVVSPEDAEALAGAVRRLLADPALARQLGARGRAYMEANLSWPRLVADWLTALQSNQPGRAEAGQEEGGT